MPRLNFSRAVKIHHPAAHFDVQFIRSDGKLDDIRVFTLVCDCLPAKWLAHYNRPARQSVYLRMNTGSLAIFAAIRRASSLVGSLARSTLADTS